MKTMSELRITLNQMKIYSNNLIEIFFRFQLKFYKLLILNLNELFKHEICIRIRIWFLPVLRKTSRLNKWKKLFIHLKNELNYIHLKTEKSRKKYI